MSSPSANHQTIAQSVRLSPTMFDSDGASAVAQLTQKDGDKDGKKMMTGVNLKRVSFNLKRDRKPLRILIPEGESSNVNLGKVVDVATTSNGDNSKPSSIHSRELSWSTDIFPPEELDELLRRAYLTVERRRDSE